MIKEKRILSYFVCWLFFGLLICFIGINDVFGATYPTNRTFSQQYYDNRGYSVSEVTTEWFESMNSYISDPITTVAGSYGAGVSFSSPIPILSNHTYTLSLYFEGTTNLAKSSDPKVAISTSIRGAANNYAEGNYYVDTIKSEVIDNTILQFVFKTNGSGEFIFIPWTTTSTVTQDYVFTQVIMEDLGSESLTQNEINNSLNNQTNIINNSIQNSTNTITGEINDMEQSIIDNQNQNTQAEIESQKVCDQIDKVNIKIDNSYLSSTGEETYNSNFGITNYIKVDTTTEITPLSILSSARYMCFYNVNKQIISCLNESTQISLNTIITIPENTSYVRFTIRKSDNVPRFKICKNGNQATNDKLDDLQGALTDSSPTDMSGLGDSAGWLPAGPVDSILTLPLTMLNNLVSNLSSQCQIVSIKLPFVNKNLNLPCIKSLYDKIGITGTLFQSAGLIASAFILFNYLLALYKWVDDTLTMRENTMPGYFDDNWGGGA